MESRIIHALLHSRPADYNATLCATTTKNDNKYGRNEESALVRILWHPPSGVMCVRVCVCLCSTRAHRTTEPDKWKTKAKSILLKTYSK